MKRAVQGVPLEALDLRTTCLATSRAVELLSEIVVEVLGPEGNPQEKGTNVGPCSSWPQLFVEDDSLMGSGVEDHDEDDPDTGRDDAVWDNEDEDETDYWYTEEEITVYQMFLQALPSGTTHQASSRASCITGTPQATGNRHQATGIRPNLYLRSPVCGGSIAGAYAPREPTVSSTNAGCVLYY